MNSSLSNPFVSVLIRSYNRLSCVLEIIEKCKEQDYENFEVVVIDQSDKTQWEEYKESFNKLNNKVRVIRSKPLGAANARNVGVSSSNGDIILFIDDDDLPIGNDWISSHAMHYKDPHCIGVSGRCIKRIGESVPYKNKQKAYDRCLTYSLFMRGRDLTGIDKVKKPVQWLHGLNASIRKSYVLKLGGWYPYIPNFEEHSFCFKLRKAMEDGEYLMFDPKPEVLRRFDIPGGLGKRQLPLQTILANQLLYYHWVVAEYYPIRFFGLYPFFILYAFRYATRWFRVYSYYSNNLWIRRFGEKYGLRLYIFQEFVKLPFLIFRTLLRNKPKWDGQHYFSSGGRDDFYEINLLKSAIID
ncbi:MAG: glycosyltransferase family 2 protein [Bacteroidetes bacterium]|nr:glycosyltransferase family 2 protein [Bacteroidota bacterium]